MIKIKMNKDEMYNSRADLAGVVALVSCLEAGDCAPPISPPGILMID